MFFSTKQSVDPIVVTRKTLIKYSTLMDLNIINSDIISDIILSALASVGCILLYYYDMFLSFHLFT